MQSAAVSTVGVGVGPRAVAIIIDIVIFWVVSFIFALISGDTSSGGFQVSGAPACLLFILELAYYPVMEVMWGGTVGKLALGLKVVRQDGAALDWGSSIIRTILRIVDFLPFFYLLGAILIWTSPTKQRLGDRVAKTLVVKKGEVVGTPAGEARF
jgi:uncharacterized RDD family membrane protein YckC